MLSNASSAYPPGQKTKHASKRVPDGGRKEKRGIFKSSPVWLAWTTTSNKKKMAKTNVMAIFRSAIWENLCRSRESNPGGLRFYYLQHVPRKQGLGARCTIFARLWAFTALVEREPFWGVYKGRNLSQCRLMWLRRWIWQQHWKDRIE